VLRFATALALTFAPCLTLAQSGPKVPSSLPTLDWKCYASVTVAFASRGSNFDELGLDGDNLKKPSIELRTIDNHVFKIIENPSITS
jgi:hypothetical protein